MSAVLKPVKGYDGPIFDADTHIQEKDWSFLPGYLPKKYHQDWLIQRKVGAVQAVDGVSFTLAKGETIGIVGESGSGKSVLVRSVMNLLPSTAEVDGRVLFEGRDVRVPAVARPLRLDEAVA